MSGASQALALFGRLHTLHVDADNVLRADKAGVLTKKLDDDSRKFFRREFLLSSPESLRRCELLWVTREMQDLLLHASTSLPPYAFNPSTLPWESAVVFFEDATVTRLPTGERDAECTRGLQWTKIAEERWLLGVISDGGAGKLMYRTTRGIGSGEDLADSLEPGTLDLAEAGRQQTARILCTLWLLVNQRVAARETIEADRASRRQYARKMNALPPSVTVIELRRPAVAPHPDHETAHTEWSHRWIVGGHWRNQYHPSDKSHVPTWIAPYVKGPDDKPLVVKDKVYAWVR